MVTAWFSRHREFRADSGAATLARGENMIAALRRLMTHRDMVDTEQQALATLMGGGGWCFSPRNRHSRRVSPRLAPGNRLESSWHV